MAGVGGRLKEDAALKDVGGAFSGDEALLPVAVTSLRLAVLARRMKACIPQS